MPLSLPDFVQRWKIRSLSERSGSQSHFIDLCDMLGQPHPAAADTVGERYTFEKPVILTRLLALNHHRAAAEGKPENRNV